MAQLPAFLEKETAGLPNWAWALVVVAGVGAAYVLPKLFGKQGSTAATSTQGSTNGIGLAIDPTTGLPYAVEGLVPGGGTSGSGTTGTTSSQPLQQELGLIRARFNDPSTKRYDEGHTGVPIHKATTAATNDLIGYATYGSVIKITGPAVQGSSNMGNNLWYPVLTSDGKTGYVSAYDFTDTQLYRQQAWPNA